MRVVKINAIWCSGCLVMNKIWKNILKKYDIKKSVLEDYNNLMDLKIGDKIIISTND